MLKRLECPLSHRAVITGFLMLLLTSFAHYGMAQEGATINTIVSLKPSENEAEKLAQQQLDAYNARDIDAFLAPYAEHVEIYSFPNELQYTGKEQMRKIYGSMFERTPDLHCTLVNRIVEGNTVIDHENVIFRKDNPPLKAIAIYKIEEGKIAKVYFIQ